MKVPSARLRVKYRDRSDRVESYFHYTGFIEDATNVKYGNHVGEICDAPGGDPGTTVEPPLPAQDCTHRRQWQQCHH